MSSKSVTASIIIPVLLLTLAACNDSKTADDAEVELEQQESAIPGEIRRAAIDVLPMADQFSGVAEAGKLNLTLFGDVVLVGEHIATTRAVPGVVTHRYSIDEPEMGAMIVSVAGDEISATIDLPVSGRMFLIRKDQETAGYVVIEIDPARLDILEGGAPVSVPGE
jgi:hypothetical protein